MVMSVMMLPEVFAGTPVGHIEVGADVYIGRPRKSCDGFWICLKNKTWNVGPVKDGMILSGNHGLVVDSEGNISMAINVDRIKAQDEVKYQTLMKGSFDLDSEESIPSEVLLKLGYKGSNIFKAGKYTVTRSDRYFLIQLNK